MKRSFWITGYGKAIRWKYRGTLAGGLVSDWLNGRLTLMDWLTLPTGVVVLGVVLIALFMFWGGAQNVSLNELETLIPEIHAQQAVNTVRHGT